MHGKQCTQLETSYGTEYDTCSITEPVQHKPHTEGWRGIENYRAQVFMDSDNVIKGAILNILDESEGAQCKRTWEMEMIKRDNAIERLSFASIQPRKRHLLTYCSCVWNGPYIQWTGLKNT